MIPLLTSVKVAFRKYPLFSNCCIYGSMVMGAEFSQQAITKYMNPSKKDTKFDFEALKRYSVYGFVINPNILYFWYKWLDRTFAGSAKSVVVKKVLLDQFLMTPPLYVIFYVGMSMLEGKADKFEELRTKFVATFTTSCFFWLPAQTINFLFLPAPARVVFVGACSFIWINILCFIKRKEM